MSSRVTLLMVTGVFFAALVATAPARPSVPEEGAIVSLEFVDEQGRVLDTYPTGSSQPDTRRAYLEAIPGARYGIRARNRTGERVGIVVAVDGRNIVSGERSQLRRREAMYVLGPYESATFSGWRTSASEVRRFYFTDSQDSYASRIGDESAIGVIAAAVFKERQPRHTMQYRQPEERAAAPGAAAEAQADKQASVGRSSQAGTGFGEREASHAVRVEFSPERHASERAFYKYEWSEQLCARGVKRCASKNRFWPDDYGFVPAPPNDRG